MGVGNKTAAPFSERPFYFPIVLRLHLLGAKCFELGKRFVKHIRCHLPSVWVCLAQTVDKA